MSCFKHVRILNYSFVQDPDQIKKPEDFIK
jgi:hypothetical protein